MSQKQRQKLGSAIASTILSLFSGVLLVGVDKAQAAVLTYNFHEETYGYNGYFKVDNSSLTGTGVEYVMVSEGIFNGFPLAPFLYLDDYNYNNLTERASAVFYQGDFRGLQAAQSVNGFRGYYFYPNESPVSPYGRYWRATGSASWEITTTQGPDNPSMWTSRISGYTQLREETEWLGTGRPNDVYEDRRDLNSAEVYYTLVGTEASPVPEPLTAGGTALALAGLSWLKHKKKRAA
jgi:hypothetical protein